ncbi:MAG: sulfite exporter TauE/SafE family protein [Verrucomicrobiales bacterium]
MKPFAWFFPACLVGVVSGIAAGFCGVGGGIVMVPAFTQWFGLTQQQAIATSLAVIIPTSIVATTQNARGVGLIDWKLALATAIGACLTAWLAADWMKRLSNITLTRIFAVLLIAVGLRLLFAKGR